MKNHLPIVTFLIGFISLSFTFATPKTIYIDNNIKEVWIGNTNCEYFEDSSTALTLSDILYLDSQSPIFKQDKNRDPLNYNTKSSYWQKFLVVDTRTKTIPVRIEFFDFDLEEISVFQPTNNGFKESTAGYNKPFANREVEHKNISFLLHPIKNDSNYFYIRYHSSNTNVLKPVFRSYDQIFNYGLKEYLLLGIFFGLLILMIFYNALYYVILKNKNYLYYVVFAIGSLFYLLAQNGLGFQFIWPSFPFLNKYTSHFSLLVSSVAMLLFTHSFFEIKNHQKINTLLWILIDIRIGIYILELLTDAKSEWIFVDILIVQTALAIGVFALKKGIKSARWFIWAFACLDLAFITSYLEIIDLIPSNILTFYALYIGIILQFVFLSISIAESFKEAYQARNSAQADLLAYQEEVNQELEEKVTQRTNELHLQKRIIEDKSNLILSSVRYAQTIQESILPDTAYLKSLIPEHFIFFKPKDMVSGDFYWVKKLDNDQYLIAAVDCTGHGIPGAFMSMIGINLLKLIVSRNITEPHLILSELHKEVQSVLKQDKTKNSDGMDMGLCLVDRKEKTIKFSGAKNPLIYIQNEKIKRIKATRKSIGGMEHGAEIIFEQHEISFAEYPISFYLLSDGYVDQFGGEKGEKYMMHNFLKLLDKIKDTSFLQQENTLSHVFKNWIGEANFQIDDVLVIGVKEA